MGFGLRGFGFGALGSWAGPDGLRFGCSGFRLEFDIWDLTFGVLGVGGLGSGFGV